jgi:hypothetical protein
LSHRGWLAVIGLAALAGGLPGFPATVGYAIDAPR